MDKPLTAYTITTAQIIGLRSDALVADDYKQVDICDIALASHETTDAEGRPLMGPDGDEMSRTDAREACADAINTANLALGGGK